MASFVLALIVCEAGLRLLGIGYPDFYDYDPFLGSKLRPGIRGHFLKEGGGYVSINSDGLRDREHSLAHPLNTLRIAVLGDSFSEAMQVNQEETFWAIMEKDLQSCPNLGGRRVEVLNFGEAGFSTAQELLALRHRAWKYAPNVILLALLPMTFAAISRSSCSMDFNPYFSLEDDRLVLHDRLTRERWEAEQQKKSWGGEFKRWRQDHFRIFQVWRQFQTLFKAWWGQTKENRGGGGGHRPSRIEAGLSDNILSRAQSKVWQEAWEVNEALLVQMRDEVAARGARFSWSWLPTAPRFIPIPPTGLCLPRVSGFRICSARIAGWRPSARRKAFPSCFWHRPSRNMPPYIRSIFTASRAIWAAVTGTSRATVWPVT